VVMGNSERKPWIDVSGLDANERAMAATTWMAFIIIIEVMMAPDNN